MAQLSRPRPRLAAAVFVAGCLGLCAILLGLGERGTLPGMIVYGAGWALASRLERAGVPRPLSTHRHQALPSLPVARLLARGAAEVNEDDRLLTDI